MSESNQPRGVGRPKLPPDQKKKPATTRSGRRSRQRAEKTLLIPCDDVGKITIHGGTRSRVNPPAIEELFLEKNIRVTAIDTLMDCLKAERSYYDPWSKTLVKEPDYATRQASAKYLLDQDIGRPIQRQQVLTVSALSMEEVRSKLSDNPKLRDEVRKILEDSERKLHPIMDTAPVYGNAPEPNVER